MDKEELWQGALALLLDGAAENDPKSIFLPLLTPFGVFGDQFILQAPTPQIESLTSYYLPEMSEKVSLVAGRPLNVGIGTAASPSPAPAERPGASSPAPAQPVPTSPAETSPAPDAGVAPDLPDWMNTYVSPADLPSPASARQAAAGGDLPERDEQRGRAAGTGDEALFAKCTFDTFVVGPSNEFARGAALAVAEKPGVAYNPLFIYGSSGLGKTHLLVAIANYIMQNWPSMRTRYVSANRFLNDYVEAAQRTQWDSFNQKYRQVDVLLVDDVQYLEGKDETINQLFNIFNDMTNRNRQIVLAADRAPKDIDMDERYRSRFMAGLLADVKPPDYETRLAIMKNYLSRVYQQTVFTGVVPDEVLDWIAETATSNIREMEGAVTRVVSNMTLLKKGTITVDEAKRLLKDFFPNPADRQIDIATIQDEVERYFGITHEDMVSSKRSKGIAMARHIAMYLSRYLTEESLESIGRKFGGRDHTTVMHSVSKIEREQKDNRVLYDQIDQLTMRIKEDR